MSRDPGRDLDLLFCWDRTISLEVSPQISAQLVICGVFISLFRGMSTPSAQ